MSFASFVYLGHCKVMLSVVREYLEQCSQRRVEPYYAFIEHAGNSEIVADIDFAPVMAIRLLAVTLLRSRPRKGGLRLHALVLRYGVNKGEHHPPQQSKRLLPYETLAARRRTEDDIMSPVNRHLLRGLLDGVRMACIAAIRHLTRLELCGLPLSGGSAIVEVTSRLFDLLPHCCSLRVLKLSHSTLTDRLFLQLTTAAMASAFPALKEAYFSECGLTDESARGLHSLITLNRSREQQAMWLSSFRNGNSGSRTVNAPVPRALEALDLSGNRLGDPTLKRLAIAITHDISLRVVDMSRNAVTTAGLVEFLQQGTLGGSGIESLDLSKNLITSNTSYGAEEGFACLCSCPEQLLLTRITGIRQCRTGSPASHGGTRLVPKGPPSPAFDRPTISTSPIPKSQASSRGQSLSAGTVVTGAEQIAAAAPLSRTTRQMSISSAVVIEGSAPETGRSSLSSILPDKERSLAVHNVYTRSSTAHVSAAMSTKPSSCKHCPGGTPSTVHPPASEKTQNQVIPDLIPQGPAPRFQPLLFSSPGGQEQQWYGVPLYITLPFNPLGGLQTAPLAPVKHDVAVGTASLQSSPQRDDADELESGPHTSNGGSESGVGDVFEEKMVEPLNSDRWEMGEWKAKEQRFLEALVVRLENHETSTAELVERNHQLTRESLKGLKEELSQRIREVLEEQRSEQRRLDMRLAAERELQDPEETLTNQLVQLIHTGMKSIHDQMAKPVGTSAAKSDIGMGASGKASCQTTQDYLREVKGFLKGLGW
ncbi:hypothetical protein, conserved [Trypanosoma brucei gambiense DAL972]|uniref:Uncharacterized protein n=1 Tax=Trypanosoma brucei gambiense (strain MHOM/CI/86/DAL972) TaxID=679716 RepID=D0A8G0_TRYB9|nr:hypothetical protein, conserved [Trypanosoma brucei gambiense DAL972]CBH17961.1 hypothetical protein, conserved [Trypanosoma brucei gambiense DAL972]|eukprot:XP_011780225.1 hypothetical protein, conserved [Trypanosoma brucei gambiense DAL972]